MIAADLFVTRRRKRGRCTSLPGDCDVSARARVTLNSGHGLKRWTLRGFSWRSDESILTNDYSQARRNPYPAQRGQFFAPRSERLKTDAISIVEAAYDISGDDASWLRQLIDRATP